MNRLLSVAALALMVAFGSMACDDDGPTDPSGQPDPEFRATLSSANEVPPVSNAEAGASGVMNVTFVVAGAITVPASARSSSAMAASRVSPHASRLARSIWDGTASTTISAPASAAAGSVDARTVAGSSRPGRYSVFS